MEQDVLPQAMTKQQSESELNNFESKKAVVISSHHQRFTHHLTGRQPREHSGGDIQSSSNNDIYEDIIQNSDEITASINNEAKRGSGRDFSYIFDADSDGPK